MTEDTEIEEPYREQMQSLARMLDRSINFAGGRDIGFFLALYKHNEPGRFNYISNSQREDVIVLLKEMIARFEGQPEMEGHA